MQQMVPIGLAIALFWGFVIAALNDDPVSIDKKQIAVKTLASEVEAARAEVIKQREAAAAYAATLHAAHAEALAVLNESRREDAAAAEKRFAEADEAHAAEVDLIRTRASREKRRLSWAFSASKALLAENNAAIQADHARMKKRFDNRDSRDDDVEKLAELTAEVRALDRVNAHLRGETEAFSRELDNRDQNDSIFGGCGSMRSSPGQGARKTTGGRSPMRSTGGRTPPSGVSSPLSTTSLSLERAKSFP
jgi:myosin heavy subunit